MTNTCRLEGVESRRWLIKQDDGWVRDKLDSNGAALSLTTGKDLLPDVSDLAVLHVSETQLLDELCNATILLLVWDLELESSSEGEGLLDRERCKEDIILHHISSILLETHVVDWN